MPLPLDPAILVDTPNEKLHIPGTLLQPWFDSGETKAITDLLSKYTTDVVDPRIEAAVIGTGTGDKYYRHVQGSASSVWNVVHSLGKRASVTVVDSGGTKVEGDVLYVNDNQVQILFNAPFSGEAFCN
jgi:hypothetical protein